MSVNTREPVQPSTNRQCDLRDVSLFKLLMKIVTIIFSIASKILRSETLSVYRHLKELPNPFYHQTASGFFIEYYYGFPSRLWTPWGSWQLPLSSSKFFGSDPFLPMFMERFKVTLYRPEKSTDFGVFGPVYALNAIDDAPLPPPLELDRQAFDDQKVVDRVWEELNKQA